jgi:hypothetical protein
MARFVKVEIVYNHQTGQGEGCKLINIDQIRHITDWSKSKLKNKKSVNSIIQLLNGEIYHVGDTIEQLEIKIKKEQQS